MASDRDAAWPPSADAPPPPPAALLTPPRARAGADAATAADADDAAVADADDAAVDALFTFSARDAAAAAVGAAAASAAAVSCASAAAAAAAAEALFAAPAPPAPLAPAPGAVYAAILAAAGEALPGAEGAAPVLVAWPCAMPVPSDATERALRPLLLRGKNKHAWAALNPRAFEELAPGARAAIAAGARAAGVELGQALSLRAHLLKSAAPHLFHGHEAAAERVAARLEAAVERFLAAAGVAFTTQAQLAAAAARAGVPCGATPDFVLRGDVRINGVRARWVEVKCFYACGAADLKAWSPTVKVQAQMQKYLAALGPGAVCFRRGYAAAFRAATPRDVMLLDPTPFADDAGTGSDDERAREAGAGRARPSAWMAAAAALPPPPPPPPPPAAGPALLLLPPPPRPQSRALEDELDGEVIF